MASGIDELTVNWEDEQGRLTTRELEKEVISKGGGWVTVMFLYEDLDAASGEYGPKKVRVQRYQKRGDKYIVQSKFNISSEKQAQEIIRTLAQWFPEK
ncbi:hypothetical protein LLH00_14210 [bacterium]|nr:hypothetical protein [bacterium]